MSNENNDPLIKKALIKIKELELEAAQTGKILHEPIAIIGMSCRFPGGANNPDTFWQLLINAQDAIVEIPQDRWQLNKDSQEYKEFGDYLRYGAFLNTPVDQFDADFFKISAREAEMMDPRQRLLLEITWEALENAAIPPIKLKGSHTGVYIGMMKNDYEELFFGTDDINMHFNTGIAGSVLAGRISYVLGLQGPSISLDTACSSSLVSIHAACNSLRLHDADLAIAGGVNLMLTPSTHRANALAKMLAKNGYAKAFDAMAQGYVRGEGAGIIILKRFSDAIRDKDIINALICGSAVNQDGASTGLTVPNADAQKKVIKKALEQAQLQPQDIDYIEAHGTGTHLGDPIEILGLKYVFKDHRKQALLIGSVKNNIGHLEGAAGVAGLIKTVLALQHQQIPAHIHVTQVNPELNLNAIPAELTLQSTDWKRSSTHVRRAGVSSFGFSGTNAHQIVQESPEKSIIDRKGLPDNFLLVISARSTEALATQIKKFCDYLANTNEHIADICYTSQIGRVHFKYRIAVNGKTLTELLNHLQKNILSTEEIAVQYKQGEKINWEKYSETYQQAVNKIVLPNCTFERKSYWPKLLTNRISSRSEKSISTLLHPLLGEKLPSIAPSKEIAFEQYIDIKTIPYLIDHQVFKTVLFPAVGYLEWIGAAAQALLPSNTDSFGSIIIKNLKIELPLKLSLDERICIQVIVDTLPEISAAPCKVAIYGKNSFGKWDCHASAVVTMGLLVADTLDNRESLKLRCSQVADISEFYKNIATQGIQYGPAFQTLKYLAAGQNEAIAEVATDHLISTEYRLYSPLLDGCLQALCCWFLQQQSTNQRGKLFLPVGIGESISYLPLSKHLLVHLTGAMVNEHDHDLHGCELSIYDFENGQLLCTIKNISLKAVSKTALLKIINRYKDYNDWFYTEQWRAIEPLHSMQLQSRFYGKSLISTWDKTMNAGFSMKIAAMQENLKVPAELLENMAIDYILLAFIALYSGLSREKKYSLNDFLQLGSIISVQIPLFIRCLELLVQQGYLISQKSENHLWEISKTLPTPLEINNQIANILSQLQDTNEAFFLQQCAKDLARVWQGKMDPLTLLFPIDETKYISAASIYEKSEVNLILNQAVAELIKTTILSASSSKQPVRILEIGAGTGGTTHLILETIAQLSTVYHYTDISPVFFGPAKERFKTYPFIQYQILDIEKDPLTQGFVPQEYDIIIAANVLHATSDMQETLANVRKLLAPYGVLCVLEGLEKTAWLDLTFGLLEGWWRHKDKQWRDYALMSPRKWKDLLVVSEFTAPKIYQLGSVGVLLSQLTPNTKPVENTQWLWITHDESINSVIDHFTSVGNSNNSISVDNLEQYLKTQTPEPVSIVYTASSQQEIVSMQDCLNFLKVLQVLIAHPWIKVPKIFIITQQAQAIINNDCLHPNQATLWGMAKVLMREHAQYNICCIDVDSITTESHQIANELLTASQELQVGFRDHKRYVGRLAPLRLPSTAQENSLFSETASYLITGGLGDIGIALTEWLIEHGAKYIALLSRRSADNAIQDKINAWQKNNVNVICISADVSDIDQLAQALQSIKKSGFPSLQGVFHAAGLVKDATISQQTAEKYLEVLAPKLTGTWNLHELTKNEPLHYFVLFSSIASLFGSPGQSNHAAANSYLDAFSFYRKQQGLPAQSINWGAWEDIGYAARVKIPAAVTEIFGIQMFKPADAFNCFEIILKNPQVARASVSPMKWSNYFKNHMSLNKLWDSELNKKTDESLFTSDFILQFEAQPANKKAQLIKMLIMKECNRVLSNEANYELDENLSFIEMGMDSLMSLEFHNRLQIHLRQNLPNDLMFSNPTIKDLVKYTINLISGKETTAELTELRKMGGYLVEDLIKQIKFNVYDRLSLPQRCITHQCLITGATGFLGAHLLASLFKNTPDHIYCLVRCKSNEDPVRKLSNILKAYELFDCIDPIRFHVIRGDFSLPGFGIDPAEYDKLADKIDTIYHIGAEVNFIKPLAILKKSNVDACQYIIDFAKLKNLKEIHYSSTLAAFPRGGDYQNQTVDENTPIDLPGYLIGGYEQSKWLGEAIMRNAQQQNLPVTIYRPGFIGGALSTAILNSKDSVTRMLLTFIESKVIPDTIPFNFNIVPVDYITDSITYLAAQSKRLPVYHFYHEKVLNVTEIMELLLANQFEVKKLSYIEWVQYISEWGAQRNFALKPLMHILSNTDSIDKFELNSHALLPNQGEITAVITKMQLPKKIIAKLIEPQKMLDLYLKKLKKLE